MFLRRFGDSRRQGRHGVHAGRHLFPLLSFRHVPYCLDAGICDTWLAHGVGLVKYTEETFYGPLNLSLTSYEIVSPREELLKYYPLQSGNYWEYKTDSYDCNPFRPCQEDTSAFSISATGDTLLPNNHFSQRIRRLRHRRRLEFWLQQHQACLCQDRSGRIRFKDRSRG